MIPEKTCINIQVYTRVFHAEKPLYEPLYKRKYTGMFRFEGGVPKSIRNAETLANRAVYSKCSMF